MVLLVDKDADTLFSCIREGAKKATYTPATPASKSEKERAAATREPSMAGRAATSLQKMVDILDARVIRSFLLS